MDWSAHGFPDKCPPEDAKEYNGFIYIYVKHNPPIDKDFRSAYDKGRHINSDSCQRKSISCGIDKSFLDSIATLFPARRGYKKATGKIGYNDGVIKQTGNQPLHHSFWIAPEKRKNFNELFTVES